MMSSVVLTSSYKSCTTSVSSTKKLFICCLECKIVEINNTGINNTRRSHRLLAIFLPLKLVAIILSGSDQRLRQHIYLSPPYNLSSSSPFVSINFQVFSLIYLSTFRFFFIIKMIICFMIICFLIVFDQCLYKIYNLSFWS